MAASNSAPSRCAHCACTDSHHGAGVLKGSRRQRAPCCRHQADSCNAPAPIGTLQLPCQSHQQHQVAHQVLEAGVDNCCNRSSERVGERVAVGHQLQQTAHQHLEGSADRDCRPWETIGAGSICGLQAALGANRALEPCGQGCRDTASLRLPGSLCLQVDWVLVQGLRPSSSWASRLAQAEHLSCALLAGQSAVRAFREAEAVMAAIATSDTLHCSVGLAPVVAQRHHCPCARRGPDLHAADSMCSITGLHFAEAGSQPMHRGACAGLRHSSGAQGDQVGKAAAQVTCPPMPPGCQSQTSSSQA